MPKAFGVLIDSELHVREGTKSVGSLNLKLNEISLHQASDME